MNFQKSLWLILVFIFGVPSRGDHRRVEIHSEVTRLCYEFPERALSDVRFQELADGRGRWVLRVAYLRRETVRRTYIDTSLATNKQHKNG